MIKKPGTGDGASCARWPGNDCEQESKWDAAPARSKALAFREVSIGGMDDVDREDNGGMQTEESFDMKLNIAIASLPREKVEDDRH